MRGFRAMEVDVLDPSKFRECVSPRLVFEVTLYTNVPLVLDYRPIVEPAVGRLSPANGRAYSLKAGDVGIRLRNHFSKALNAPTPDALDYWRAANETLGRYPPLGESPWLLERREGVTVVAGSCEWHW